MQHHAASANDGPDTRVVTFRTTDGAHEVGTYGNCRVASIADRDPITRIAFFHAAD